MRISKVENLTHTGNVSTSSFDKDSSNTVSFDSFSNCDSLSGGFGSMFDFVKIGPVFYNIHVLYNVHE